RAVPHLDGLVHAPRDDPCAVRREHNGLNLTGMPFESESRGIRNVLADRMEVPDLDSAIAAAGGEARAVRAESDALDGAGVTLERENRYALIDLGALTQPRSPPHL